MAASGNVNPQARSPIAFGPDASKVLSFNPIAAQGKHVSNLCLRHELWLLY